jgi:hypothetical protein
LIGQLLRVVLSETSVEIEEVDRVVRIYGMNPVVGIRRSSVTLDDFDALSGARSFEAIGDYHDVEMAVGTGTEDDVVRGMLVSPRFFDDLRGCSRRRIASTTRPPRS